MRLNFPQFEELYKNAEKENLAFCLDWKLPVEDIVFNIKTVCPDLCISSLPEKQIRGDWFERMDIEGNEYTFSANSKTLVQNVISIVNRHLEKSNQTLVYFDTQDDNRYFFLISLPDLLQYQNKGFVACNLSISHS